MSADGLGVSAGSRVPVLCAVDSGLWTQGGQCSSMGIVATGMRGQRVALYVLMCLLQVVCHNEPRSPKLAGYLLPPHRTLP